MPVINIYGKKKINSATKKLGKELIKEAGPEHKLRICAYDYVKVLNLVLVGRLITLTLTQYFIVDYTPET